MDKSNICKADPTQCNQCALSNFASSLRGTPTTQHGASASAAAGEAREWCACCIERAERAPKRAHGPAAAAKGGGGGGTRVGVGVAPVGAAARRARPVARAHRAARAAGARGRRRARPRALPLARALPGDPAVARSRLLPRRRAHRREHHRTLHVVGPRELLSAAGVFLMTIVR